jgi:hypothetical protein
MKSIAEKGPMLSSPKLSAELSGKLLKFLIEINDDICHRKVHILSKPYEK